MIQKIEKLLDLAAEALSLYIEEARRGRGETLPLEEKAVVEEKVEKRGRPRKEKVEKAAASPFEPLASSAEAPASKLSAEDALEAARRGQEVMGLFIRRYLKASPSGLERAKKILIDTLGLPRNGEAAWKLEHLTPQDWLKLTPIFETKLDEVQA